MVRFRESHKSTTTNENMAMNDSKVCMLSHVPLTLTHSDSDAYVHREIHTLVVYLYATYIVAASWPL